MALFDLAIEELRRSGANASQSESFAEYCKRSGYPKLNTAASISKDTLQALSPELKAAGMMVFRLGRGDFALARICASDWSDYFIVQDRIDGGGTVEVFVPAVPARTLFAYQLLPTFTETSGVNLAVASGLLGEALELAESEFPAAPATGSSTFSFPFTPMANSITWQHRKGQVQIDALITGKRRGKTALFVIEAKLGDECLAKHKLVYPLLSIAPQVPLSMQIVPVYVQIVKDAGRGLIFVVTECEFDHRVAVPVLADLRPVMRKSFFLPGYGKKLTQ